LKPYRHSGFQILGEKIKNRFAKADRLEAGGLSPLSGKSTMLVVSMVVYLSSVGLLSRNNNSTRYAANLQTTQTPDSVIAR
jgi:hypothetical protein